jgi:hypothetical protein
MTAIQDPLLAAEWTADRLARQSREEEHTVTLDPLRRREVGGTVRMRHSGSVQY